MAKQKKLKDKKIVIYRETNTGGLAIGYIPIHRESLWAYIRQLSEKEYYAAKAVQITEDMIFTVNYRPDITPDCAVRYKGVFYGITRVDTFEGYKDDLKLYATVKLHQPEEGEILPYGDTEINSQEDS